MMYSVANAKYYTHHKIEFKSSIIRYSLLQVNPHSAACTDEINSIWNIHGIEAKNSIKLRLSTLMAS